MRRECGLRLCRVQIGVRFWGEISLLAGNLQGIFPNFAQLDASKSEMHNCFHVLKRNSLEPEQEICRELDRRKRRFISDVINWAASHPEHPLLVDPIQWDGLAQNLLKSEVWRQGAIANCQLYFWREKCQLAALANKRPGAVCLVCNVLDLHFAFQSLRPMMRLSERLRQGGIGRGQSFSNHQLGFDPAAAQMKRCLNIAKICGKVTRRDPEVGWPSVRPWLRDHGFCYRMNPLARLTLAHGFLCTSS